MSSLADPPVRPPWITPKDWTRMSWHARRRATRKAHKPRISRRGPGYWELTNGITTARGHSAEELWSLVYLTRAQDRRAA